MDKEIKKQDDHLLQHVREDALNFMRTRPERYAGLHDRVLAYLGTDLDAAHTLLIFLLWEAQLRNPFGKWQFTCCDMIVGADHQSYGKKTCARCDELNALKNKAAHLQQEAELQAMEARGQRNTVYEAYKAVGASGIGSYHGAEPIVAYVLAMQEFVGAVTSHLLYTNGTIMRNDLIERIRDINMRFAGVFAPLPSIK